MRNFAAACVTAALFVFVATHCSQGPAIGLAAFLIFFTVMGMTESGGKA